MATLRLENIFKNGKPNYLEIEKEVKDALEKYGVPLRERLTVTKAVKNHLNEVQAERQFFLDLQQSAQTSIWDKSRTSKWFTGKDFSAWKGGITAEFQTVYKSSKLMILIRHITRLDLNRLYLAPHFDLEHPVNDRRGSIPASIGNLKYLIKLDLCFNFLRGDIPSKIGNLKNLEILKLEFNQLHGKIPTTIKNLTKLTYLALDHNRLEGNISMLSNLKDLTLLNIHENKLSLSKATMETLAGYEGLKQCWFYRNGSFSVAPGSMVEKRIKDSKYSWKAEDNNE